MEDVARNAAVSLRTFSTFHQIRFERARVRLGHSAAALSRAAPHAEASSRRGQIVARRKPPEIARGRAICSCGTVGAQWSVAYVAANRFR